MSHAAVDDDVHDDADGDPVVPEHDRGSTGKVVRDLRPDVLDESATLLGHPLPRVKIAERGDGDWVVALGEHAVGQDESVDLVLIEVREPGRHPALDRELIVPQCLEADLRHRGNDFGNLVGVAPRESRAQQMLYLPVKEPQDDEAFQNFARDRGEY